MTKKQKRQLVKGLFGVLIAFLLVVLVFFNIKVDAETANFVVKMNDFSVKLVNNLTQNIVFYGLIILVVLISVSYFRKRK